MPHATESRRKPRCTAGRAQHLRREDTEVAGEAAHQRPVDRDRHEERTRERDAAEAGLQEVHEGAVGGERDHRAGDQGHQGEQHHPRHLAAPGGTPPHGADGPGERGEDRDTRSRDLRREHVEDRGHDRGFERLGQRAARELAQRRYGQRHVVDGTDDAAPEKCGRPVSRASGQPPWR